MEWKVSQEKSWKRGSDGSRERETILFPHIEDYVDLVAIDTFLGKRDQGESPFIAVLANTYYTLNYYYEKNGRWLRCCTSLLYLWMTAHLFHSKGRTTCSIEDHN
ncbi:hypothetical protein CR513_47427, partial [Mucuna pruriens]